MILLATLFLATQVANYEWKGAFKLHDIPMSENLTIECSGLKQGDVVNIVPSNKKPTFVCLYAKRSATFPHPPILREARPGDFSIASGMVKIHRAENGDEDEKLFAFIEVPTSTELELKNEGKLVMKGKLLSSIMLRDDRIGRGHSQASAALVETLLGHWPTGKESRIKGGLYFIPFSLLESHIEHLVLPNLTTEGETLVTFFLTIDQDGTISDVRFPPHARRDIANQFESAVRQWKFKPVIREGRPVKVITTVPMLIKGDRVIWRTEQ